MPLPANAETACHFSTRQQFTPSTMPLNFECKARTRQLAELENRLLALKPLFIGEDLQVDTYFNVAFGRLKLREGKIENALIQYHREDLATSKTSTVLLYQHSPNPELKKILTASLGVRVVVEKMRRIYFIDNVKFHFDRLSGLGEFVEVEAIDKEGDIGLDTLKRQCTYYAELLGIRKEDMVAGSYSDLLLKH